MAHETIKISNQGVHVLEGTITNVSGEEVNFAEFGTLDDMPNMGCCHVRLDKYYEEVKNIPIFYHCENSEVANTSGGGFSIFDRVIVINYGVADILDATMMKIVGFVDGLPKKCNCDLSAKIKVAGIWVSSRYIQYEEGDLLSGNRWVSLYAEIGDTKVFPYLPIETCRGLGGPFIRTTTSSLQNGMGGYPCYYFYVNTEIYGGVFYWYVNGDYSFFPKPSPVYKDFMSREVIPEIEGLSYVVLYKTPYVQDECIRTIPIELRCKIGANTEDYIILDTLNIKVLSPYWGRYYIFHDAPCSNVTGRRIYYDVYNCLGKHVRTDFILEPGTQVWYSSWIKAYRKICPYNERPVLASVFQDS